MANEPNQIDVQLSLLGDESKLEVQSLTTLLTDLMARLPAASEFSSEGAQQAAQAAQTTYVTPTQGSRDTAGTAREQHERQREAAGQGASDDPANSPAAQEAKNRKELLDTWKERMAYTGQAFLGKERPDIDKFAREEIGEEAYKEREKRRARSGPLGRAIDAHLEGQAAKESGGPSIGASMPGDVEPDSMQPTGSTTGEGPPGYFPGGLPGQMGGSFGASRPPEPPPGVNQEAYAQFSHLLGSRENQPRFGEWQTQDYLRMAARAMGGFGARRAERQSIGGGEPGIMADWAQRGGAMFSRAEQLYPTVHALGGWVARSTGVGQHDYSINNIWNPTAGLERMEGSGYTQRQGGQVNLGPIGFQAPKWLRSGPLAAIPGIRDINPFATEAGKEAAEQGLTAWREGISNPALGVERAGEINDVVNTKGWNRPGQEARNEAFKSAGFETFGNTDRFGNMEALSTEAWADFVDNFTHLGQNTFEEAITVMEGFNDAADASGLSLDELTAQAEATSEVFKEFGGTGLGGAQHATDFTRTTGLPAALSDKMMSNPWFQTNVALQGVNPAYAAALPNEQITAAQIGAVQQVDQMVAGTHSNIRSPIVVNGKTIGQQYTTGREQDDAMGAAQMGISVDEYRMMRKEGKDLNTLEMATSAWENQFNKAKRANTGLSDKELSEMADVTGERGARVSTAELEEAMEAAKFSEEEIDTVLEKSGKSRTGEIRKIIAEKTKVGADRGEAPVIELSAEAKRWFEINNPDAYREYAEAQRRGEERMTGKPTTAPIPRASNAPSRETQPGMGF